MKPWRRFLPESVSTAERMHQRRRANYDLCPSRTPSASLQRSSTSITRRTSAATVCNTVHPMLWDRCLSICLSVCLFCRVLSVLSVMLVYCGQTVGLIKMPLGMEVCLGPGHTVLDGDPAAPKWIQPPFLANVCCGQTAG